MTPPFSPVDRVLALAAVRSPGAAAAADDALRDALTGVAASTWPDVAWRFSRITGDGYPVEFTFSSHDHALRYTAEIAGPEMGHHARIADARRWAGLTQKTSPVDEGWSGIGTLPRWSAWVGGSHAGVRNRRKVYLEASTIEAGIARWLPAGTVPRFVGVTAAEEREYYFRRDGLEVAELGRLLCGVNLRECVAPLVAAVAATLPRPVRDVLLPAEAGFSLVMGQAVSLFTYARSVWGSDGEIRRRFLDLASHHGWDVDLYDNVTRPLQNAGGYLTHHGILAWIAVPGRPVELRISVRPPIEA